MKTTLFPCGLLAVLLSLSGAHAADARALVAEARAHADNVIREIQLDAALEHYRHVQHERFKAELEDRLAAMKAKTASGSTGLAPEEAAMRQGRLKVLAQTSAELEERIRALIQQSAQAEPAVKTKAPGETVRWVGSGRDGDQEMHLVIELQGDSGRFVVEAGEGRLAGGVKVRGEKCDLRVEEASADLQKYVGQTALGLCRRIDDRLAIVLNEPGTPERPAKLEAEGDAKGFLLERKTK